MNPNDAVLWNQQGVELGNQRRFTAALAAFDQAITLAPRMALAWSNRSWILGNLGRFAEALTAADQALALESDLCLAWNNKGWAHDNLGQWDAALAAYDRALELEKTHPLAWKNKVNLLHRLGQTATAAEAAFAIGYHLGEQGQYAEALEAYQSVLQLNPSHAAAWNNTGWMHEYLSRWDEALAAYDRALELEKTHPLAWKNKVDLQRRMGRATAAAETAVTISHQLFQQDQYAQALEASEQALQLDPRNAMAWNNKGACLQKLGRPDEAHKAFEQALAIDPQHALAISNLAVLSPPATPVPKPTPPSPPPSTPAQPAPTPQPELVTVVVTLPPRRDPVPAPKPAPPLPAPKPPVQPAPAPTPAPPVPPVPAPTPAKAEPRHRIFIDTSSLMEQQADRFFQRWIESRARQPHIQVFVPLSVAHEIQKHLNGANDDKRRKAEQAAGVLKTYLRQGLVELFDDPDKQLADNVFLTLFQRFCLHYDLTLVTQDSNLAQDILDIRKRRSVRVRKRISAVRIAKDGSAHPWRDTAELEPQERDLPKSRTKKPGPVYQLRAGTTQIDVSPLPLTRPAAEGDWLFTAQHKPLRLGKVLGRGGEGAVFLTETDLVCKTYGPKPPTRATREKLERMCVQPLQRPGLCWPRELVFNEGGEFVGFLMPPAGGHELQHTVMHPKLLGDTFPEWNRLQLVTLAIKILDMIAYLHSNNVLLGDLNPSNILVEDETTVHFVDTDSFQIEEFPCPVGKVPFVHPELMGRDFSTLLRTLEHEHFAVATLVFMLLLPGKPPYSHQGGEGLNVNVLKGHFPYPLGEKRGQGVPQGPWRFIWSHLPKYVKQELHDYFTGQVGKNTADWLRLLRRYLDDLDTGRLGVSGLELFPQGYKLLSKEEVLRRGGTWHVCKGGDHEYGLLPGEKDLGYCRNCLVKRIVIPCGRCQAQTRVQLWRYLERGNQRLLCETCKGQSRRGG